MTLYRGIDINQANWVSDWQKVKNAGIQVVINKATEGTYYRDKYIQYRRGICKQLGILFGTYHFAGHENIASEVDAFIGYTSRMQFDTIYWLDIEQPPKGYSWRWQGSYPATYTNQFINLFEQKTNKEIGIYTNKTFYNDFLKGKISSNIKLWIASYGVTNCPYNGISWQYTENGRVPGIPNNVDMDWFTEDIFSNRVIPNPINTKLKEQIKALQYDLNIDYNAKLDVDGIVGFATSAALKSIQNIIVKGHKSHVVLWIQQKLENYGYLKNKNYKEMIYDEPTFQAVTNMQKNWGLVTDGIIGSKTWNVFLNN